jgi:hypothetical protein
LRAARRDQTEGLAWLLESSERVDFIALAAEQQGWMTRNARIPPGRGPLAFLCHEALERGNCRVARFIITRLGHKIADEEVLSLLAPRIKDDAAALEVAISVAEQIIADKACEPALREGIR